MHNPEYILENKTQKIIWDFEIQTVHLISAWQPDFIIINKKKKKKKKKKAWTRRIVDFAVQAYRWMKLKEN